MDPLIISTVDNANYQKSTELPGIQWWLHDEFRLVEASNGPEAQTRLEPPSPGSQEQRMELEGQISQSQREK